jgi:hypothetical protein
MIDINPHRRLSLRRMLTVKMIARCCSINTSHLRASREASSLGGVVNFGASMALDRFRLLLVKANQFRPGLLVDTQQFIQLGMQRQ